MEPAWARRAAPPHHAGEHQDAARHGRGHSPRLVGLSRLVGRGVRRDRVRALPRDGRDLALERIAVWRNRRGCAGQRRRVWSRGVRAAFLERPSDPAGRRAARKRGRTGLWHLPHRIRRPALPRPNRSRARTPLGRQREPYLLGQPQGNDRLGDRLRPARGASRRHVEGSRATADRRTAHRGGLDDDGQDDDDGSAPGSGRQEHGRHPDDRGDEDRRAARSTKLGGRSDCSIYSRP
ncbi:MAG: hypothetical protein QOJ46_778 [bacterium]